MENFDSLKKRNKKNTAFQDGFYLNDKVLVFGEIGFISGFCQGGMYVKSIDNKYITKTGKSYKQVNFNNVTRLYHNGNWQFVVQKQELQFIPHLATAVA